MKFKQGHFANGVLRVRLHLMLSAKTLGMLVKSPHKNWKKAKATSFAQIDLMCLLNIAKMKETWT